MGEPTIDQPGWFGTTQWTMVLAAREDDDGAGAQRALENLCRTYWLPLYGYVRRKGYQSADAEDLTQGFLAQLLHKGGLATVGPEKGKFRTFLLTCMNNYVRDEWVKRSAQKRGGDCTILSLDWEDAETQYQLDPADERSPSHYFERKWAFQVLARALVRLRESYAESGKEALFDRLKPFLSGDSERGQISAIAAELEMNEPAVRVAVSRLRKRYRDMLRAEVFDTVADPEAADEEYEHVCRVLCGA